MDHVHTVYGPGGGGGQGGDSDDEDEEEEEEEEPDPPVLPWQEFLDLVENLYEIDLSDCDDFDDGGTIQPPPGIDPDPAHGDEGGPGDDEDCCQSLWDWYQALPGVSNGDDAELSDILEHLTDPAFLDTILPCL